MHINEVADALSTNRNNASNAIADALKHGLVRRVGTRTGQVELVPESPELAPRPPIHAALMQRRRSHADRLVGLLSDRGEPVHLDDIQACLGTSRGTVQEVIRQAVKTGKVRRVGSRTGLVALPEPAPQEPPEAAESASGSPGQAEPAAAAPAARETAPVPASSAGIAARVVAVLEGVEGWSTARDVAAVLGCRPREAGNALAQLVQRGAAERRRDGDGPNEYRRPTM